MYFRKTELNQERKRHWGPRKENPTQKNRQKQVSKQQLTGSREKNKTKKQSKLENEAM